MIEFGVAYTKSKLKQWALLLADCDFDVYHEPSTSNQAIASLSRNPACNHELNRSLSEREVSELVQKSKKGPVLMITRKDIIFNC